MRFSANISMLFHEVAFLDRFERARAAGFSAVEFWWPAGIDLNAVQEAVARAELRVAVLNFDAGDMANGERGFVSDPTRQERFREHVPVALRLAKAVDCDALNTLVGLRSPRLILEEQLEVARRNVAWAADQAARQGAVVLLEAINSIENGPYLLTSTRQASELRQSIGRENVLLQYDAYHMQRMEGNLVETLRTYMSEVGHVQIADCPGRGEPGSGEINFPFVLGQLQELGYRGYVGLEYRPSNGNTEESLHWLPRAMRDAEVLPAALKIMSG